jgi:hypothetical protein
MTNNPHPTHITDEMWWFVEQLDLLDGADTVFAGAWGDFKPGGHCDAYNLWWHKNKAGQYDWRNDYTLKLPDDKVLGTDLEHYGAAVDLTFRSAQNGDMRTIRKYGSRIRAAWVARDPRLKGWREVLIQGDADAPADGYDFVSWTERTPDSTHTWHGHWTVLRKYLRQITIYQAMLSILRGETLAQWLAGRGDDDMPKAILYKGSYWVAKGGTLDAIKDGDDMAKVNALYPGSCFPGADKNGFPTPDLSAQNWTDDEVARLIGRPFVPPAGTGGGGGLTEAQVRALAKDEIGKSKNIAAP